MMDPRTAIRPSETRRLKAWAIKPIKGGPKRKPRYPMVDTAARATPGERVFERPAALYIKGTTEETPAPTIRKPKIAGNSQGNAIAISRPEAVSKPLP